MPSTFSKTRTLNQSNPFHQARKAKAAQREKLQAKRNLTLVIQMFGPADAETLFLTEEAARSYRFDAAYPFGFGPEAA